MKEVLEYKKLVLFGAGGTGKAVIHYFENRVVAVIDNDPSKQGSLFEGVTVISLDEYKEKYNDCTIVVSIYSYRYYDVIEQLKENGITNYFTLPPLVYNFPSLEEYESRIEEKNPKKVVFDTINPISVSVYHNLISRGIECEFAENIDNISLDENDLFVITTSEAEICIREKTQNISDNQVFDFYSAVPIKNELLKFKNLHFGEKCFVIGNGPSLRKEDLNLIKDKNICCFASNGIFNIYDETEWRPNYYTIIDVTCLDRFAKGIESLNKETCFVSDSRYINSKKYEGVNYFNVKNYVTKDELFEFSNEISKYIVSGKTVTYAMLQIACYMGFKEIYLLGVDWTGGKGTGTQRFDFYDKEIPSKNIGAYDIIAEEEKSYKSSRKFSDDNGIRIYNATRGGELEVFPRVNFDEIMEVW